MSRVWPASTLEDNHDIEVHLGDAATTSNLWRARVNPDVYILSHSIHLAVKNARKMAIRRSLAPSTVGPLCKQKIPLSLGYAFTSKSSQPPHLNKILRL